MISGKIKLSFVALLLAACAQSPDSLVEHDGFNKATATIKGATASDLPRETLPVDLKVFNTVQTTFGFRRQTSRIDQKGGVADCRIDNDVFEVRFLTPAVVNLPIVDEIRMVCDIYFKDQKITRTRILKPTLQKFNFGREERLSYAKQRERVGLNGGILFLIPAEGTFNGKAARVPPDVADAIAKSLAKNVFLE